MINAGFDWDLWKVKSVVIFPALAVQCSMRERVLTWLFQIYFLLHHNCAKLQIYFSVWKALFWARVLLVVSHQGVSQLCPQRNSCVEWETAEEVAQYLAALFGWLIKPLSLAGCESLIHGCDLFRAGLTRWKNRKYGGGKRRKFCACNGDKSDGVFWQGLCWIQHLKRTTVLEEN